MVWVCLPYFDRLDYYILLAVGCVLGCLVGLGLVVISVVVVVGCCFGCTGWVFLFGWLVCLLFLWFDWWGVFCLV